MRGPDAVATSKVFHPYFRLVGRTAVFGILATLAFGLHGVTLPGDEPATTRPVSASAPGISTPSPAHRTVAASSEPPDPDAATVIGQLGGATGCVTADGSRAYVGVGARLDVLDVSGPVPRLLGESAPFDGLVVDVAVTAGGLAVAHETGLSLVAVGNDGSLEVRGTLPLTATIVRAVSDHVVYVIDGAERLSVVDVAGSGPPRRVATLDAPRAVDVEIGGDYAYVIDETHLHVLDTSRADTPVPVASLDVSDGRDGGLVGLAVEGDLAFVSGWYYYDGTHFTVVDVSDPARPTTLRRRGGYLLTMHGTGGLLVGTYMGRIYVMDVTRPDALVTRSAIPIEEDWVEDIEIAGDQVFVAVANQGLRTFTLDLDPAVGTLAPSGTWSHVGPVMDVVASDGRLLVLDGYPSVAQRLRLLDPSDPAVPRSLCASDVGPRRIVLAAGGGFAFLDGFGGIATVEVRGSDCHAPALTVAPAHPDLNPASWWVDLAGDGDLLYGLTESYTGDQVEGQNAMAVMRVVAGGDLDVLSVLPLEGRPTRLAVDGTTAYVLESMARDPDSARLTTIDVADPRRPRVLGRLDGLAGYPWAIVAAGDVAYVACGALSVVDVSDPARPRLRGAVPASVGDPGSPTWPRSWFAQVALTGDRLIASEEIERRMSEHEHLTRVIDVSDLDRPAVVGTLHLPGFGRSYDARTGMAAADGVVWLAQGGGGLYAIAVPGGSRAGELLSLPAAFR